MYLIILDNGTMYKSKEVPEQELENADNGLLDVVSLCGPQPAQYIGGEWVGIDDLPNFTGD